MAHDHSHAHGDESHTHEHGDDGVQACIEECLNCHATCIMAAQYCLAEGGELADIDLVSVLMDCAEICQVSANFLLRGSPYHVITCAACAELCRACEEACRGVTGNEQLAHCADECASCAEHCERMSEEEEEGEEE